MLELETGDADLQARVQHVEPLVERPASLPPPSPSLQSRSSTHQTPQIFAAPDSIWAIRRTDPPNGG
jgi:hypothetical protein